MQKIITRTAEISVDENGIVHKKYFDDIDIELEDSRENLRAVMQLTQGRSYVVLADGRIHARVSAEARQFAASKEASTNRIAEAILVSSVASRLTANFYIKFNKPSTPTRIFNDEAKALAWLHRFLPMINPRAAEKRSLVML